MRKIVSLFVLLAAALPGMGARAALPLAVQRDAAPVVLTGKQLPAMSAPAPMPVRPSDRDFEHPGTSPLPQRPASPQPPDAVVTPPDSSFDGANVAPGTIGVFRYNGSGFVEVPSQVDERFWRFLANPGGENGEYSGFDPELTYVFDQEGFRKTAGACYAEFPAGPITTPDNVSGFDDDDEVAFMARDAGTRAPTGATPITGAISYEVTVTDPITDAVSYAYVVSSPSLTHSFGDGYVSYERDLYADRYEGARSGEGIPGGTLCSGPDPTSTISGTVAARRPRDTATFTSDRYTFHWGGRWTPDEIHIRTGSGYGPDLIDQWKGRAFQLARKQAVSVGYIGDASWNDTSVTLGERSGPIRVLRETWGAKSGTNVTRLYTLYDRVFFDEFFARVHAIPPDGIYSMWDHNKDSVSTYYSPATGASGVPIDGVNDEMVGNLDVGVGTPAESHYDIADPTVQPFTPVNNWEEVAGNNGSIVYYLRQPKPGAGVITSYYRDDATFDDGTGSDPSPARGVQGSFGTHGVHFYATGDTDNLGTGIAYDELNVIQSQYMLPGNAGNVGDQYATAERLPLIVGTSPI